MEKELFTLCKNCGKEFRSTKYNLKYCSEECFKKSRTIHDMIYYKENREKILIKKKYCKYCGEKCGKKELIKGYCLKEECQKERKKEKNRIAQRKYYNKHKKKKTTKYIKKEQKRSTRYRVENSKQINNRKRGTQKEKREWVDNIKKEQKCFICKEDRWYCLVFHHMDPKNKIFGIANAISGGYSKEEISKEIEKCIVLCANCHREFHYKEKVEKKLKNKKKKQEEEKQKNIEILNKYSKYREQKKEYEEYNKQKEENKIIYYKIVEEEIKKEWIKDLKDKANKNSKVFKGNQFTEFRNTVKEKINISKEISEKLNFSKCSVSKCLQIYKRGTEDQKKRAREGIDLLDKIYRELEPIRNIRKDKIQ